MNRTAWVRKLHRGWRRLLPWGRPAAAVEFVYSPEYDADLAQTGHDPERGKRILAFLASKSLLRRRRVHRPEPIAPRALRRVHTDRYLESLEEPETLLAILGYELPASRLDYFLQVHRTMVGGTVAATRLALSKRAVAVNLGGGFHHALAERGQGFCVFNDVAVAIAEERARGYKAPILVVDLDLHDGEGTRSIFAGDPSVHTLSIHNRDLGSPEATASTSIALGEGVEDAAYLDALRGHLPPLMESVRPGLVFYLAGCDPAVDDRLGDWRISPAGMLERDRFVLSQVFGEGRKVPLVLLLAGGYGHNAWRYTARFLSELLVGGEVIEPPSTAELTLAQYRRLSRLLSSTDLTREPADAEWRLTEEDLAGVLGQPEPTRFLNYYTRHGIELALERYGFLDRLSSKGFRNPRLELDLGDPASHTLRVFESGVEEPLIEMRLRRDGRTVPGMQLLEIGWLMLQDPRDSFAPGRPGLPGQKHPSLGLLQEVVSLLVIVCERLGLDGMFFTPAHYHLAVQSRRHARFLEPENEARFRALMEVLGGLRLAEATHALENGRVVDPAGGETVRWKPAPMVLPLTERLKRRTGSKEYENSVAALAGRFAFRLNPEVGKPE